MLCHLDVHLCRSVHHCKSKLVWFIFKGIQSKGSLADIPLYCKRRRTVPVDTDCCVRDCIRCVMIVDVAMHSISAMRIICLCSSGVVLRSDCDRKLLVFLSLLHPSIPYSQDCCSATSYTVTKFSEA